MAEEIILRAEARAQGLNYYFSGKPCHKGHIAKRTLSKSKCYICKREETYRWAKKNPAKRSVQKSRYYFRYRDEILIKFKEYDQKNILEKRARGAKRKAIKKNAGCGRYTAADVLDILKAQRGRCAYCREKVGKKYHVDHIIPLAKGGMNNRRNVQIACAACNLRKFTKDPIDYARSQGMLL